MSPLAKRIYDAHISFIRKMNDMHIFVQQALPILTEAQSEYAKSRHKDDRKYFVPSRRKQGTAKRTDRELKDIYESYIQRELYSTFLVSAVSQFEYFLLDILRLVIREYPQKLTASVQGVSPCKEAPVALILDAETIPQAIEIVIEHHLATVFYAAPKAYLQYFEKITGVPATDDAFADYIEIKAARDLIIHNGGQINLVYIQKAGAKARGTVGARLPIDGKYFDSVIGTLKGLSGFIHKETDKAFPGPIKPKKK